MAVDMFLKISGPDVRGESSDKDHKDEIDVLAWSWGASQPGSTHGGSRGAGVRAAFQDLSVTKWVDSSSADLLQFVSTGRLVKEMILTVRKAGDSKLEYIKYTFSTVLVSSLSTGGSGGEDRLTENISLNFARFRFEYTAQKPNGKPDKKKSDDFEFDIPSDEAQ